jgi:hypothetical protein
MLLEIYAIIIMRCTTSFVLNHCFTLEEKTNMTLTEKIHEQLLTLPETRQAQVLDFIEFLLSKGETNGHDSIETDDTGWSAVSLEMAMRGMEDEEELYTIEDLKETF